MTYFSFHPKITRNNRIVTDITIRSGFFTRNKDNPILYEFFQINDYDKPEDIAYKFYNDPTLYWVVLLANNMSNPFTDWPLNSTDFDAYVEKKYDDPEGVHHYENDLGEWINSPVGTPSAKTISNRAYEFKINENKRKIKLIRKDFIPSILADYRLSISSTNSIENK